MKYRYIAIILIIASTFIACRISKKSAPVLKNHIAEATNQPNKIGGDSIKKASAGKVKPYEQVITKKAITQRGLFKVHVLDNRYFLEIPDSLLGRDLLIVNRIARGAVGASGGMTGYAGDQINEGVIQFSRGPNDKLFIRKVVYIERSADSTENGMYRAVSSAGIQPIIASFDVKAYTKDSSALVVDFTDYLNADNNVLFFDANSKKEIKLGGLQADKSYISGISVYPENVELKTVKTYSGEGVASNATYELNSSIRRLPDQLMKTRDNDYRVGYFAFGYVDFDENSQSTENKELITRWKLEPKDEAKYLAGELAEPKKQIVFYIDPATPKKWVPYLIQGVNDWNIAFEAAGFKNAIVAKEAPTKAQDSTWSLSDSRYSAIVYKPSSVSNASGPHVRDPRTGEILESHVNWYHNVMKLLRNWYFIQASAVDPRARKMKFDDELMGQLIRFVSSHEVGHTLGLRHNFGSSATVPVEKLRDKKWVEAHGHTPSIMDYARFNYVAQPEDGISEKGIFPRIGDYDKWAIEWAYRWYPENRFATKTAEKAYLNQWLIARTTENPRLRYGTEESKMDPRNQSEDLGDNAMTASTYGIRNLKRILPNLVSWTKIDNEGYDNAKEMYKELLDQYSRYIGHVVRNIAGMMTNLKTVEQSGPVKVLVPKTKQKEAMRFLQTQVFSNSEWLINKDLFAKTGAAGYSGVINGSQTRVLAQLLNAETLFKLQQFKNYDAKAAYAPEEMLEELQTGIFSELRSGTPINVHRRNLQKIYTNMLMQLIKPTGQQKAPVDLDDVSSVLKAELKRLHAMVRKGSTTATDKLTKLHLLDLNERINDFYKDSK